MQPGSGSCCALGYIGGHARGAIGALCRDHRFGSASRRTGSFLFVSDASPTTMARAAELFRRGPARVSVRGLKQRLRRRLGVVLFRALKPYLTYKREFDRAMVVQREFDRAMVVRVENVEAELFERRRRQSEQIERLEALVEDLVSTAESLRRRIADDEQALGAEQALRAELQAVQLGAEQALRAELQAVPYIADSPFEQFESLVGDVTGYRSLNSAAGAASPYAGFEDLFRGPAERVTELQRPYLGLVAEHQPVLDVGCGRGEFLALLAAEGIVARGVDSDRGMIERCRAQGLPVALADALEYLEGLHDASLGTVFCAQVIEHLTADQLRQLLELARRKLEPGGLFIAETINPHSIPALKMFWVDLTHQHPVFPEVALALCALAGFGPAYVFAPGYPSFEAARFDATSYAVVATSPGSAER